MALFPQVSTPPPSLRFACWCVRTGFVIDDFQMHEVLIADVSQQKKFLAVGYNHPGAVIELHWCLPSKGWPVFSSIPTAPVKAPCRSSPAWTSYFFGTVRVQVGHGISTAGRNTAHHAKRIKQLITIP